jgi:hypothetical protein
MIEAVLVMLNNYFHDLAVAFLWASSLLAWVVVGHWPGHPSERVVRLLGRVAWGSLAWVLIGGAIRAYFYREYEWLPKAGTAQVPALALKHVLLFGLTAWGLVGVVRLQRRMRDRDQA